MNNFSIVLIVLICSMLIESIIENISKTIQKCSSNKYDYLKYKNFIAYQIYLDGELDDDFEEFDEIAKQVRNKLNREIIHE